MGAWVCAGSLQLEPLGDEAGGSSRRNLVLHFRPGEASLQASVFPARKEICFSSLALLLTADKSLPVLTLASKH